MTRSIAELYAAIAALRARQQEIRRVRFVAAPDVEEMLWQLLDDRALRIQELTRENARIPELERENERLRSQLARRG